MLCCFIYFVRPENLVKHFVAISSQLQIYVYTLSRLLQKSLVFSQEFTYLWHTRETITISDESNKQHMQKFWLAHSCYKMLQLGQFSHGRVIFLPALVKKDPGSIFLISLEKISQSTKYFVCYLYSYYLRINRSLIIVYIPPISKMTCVVLMRVTVDSFAI